MKEISEHFVSEEQFNNCQSGTTNTVPGTVAYSEYIEVYNAVRLVSELVANSLFSDALKSIRSKKDKFIRLPDILEQLYYANPEQRELVAAESIQAPAELRKTFSDKSTMETSKKECNSLLKRHYSKTSSEFNTLCMNKTDTELKYIIYFKEYSYPRYFNTFIKSLFEAINAEFKTRLLIYEQPGSKINLRKYDKKYLVEFDPQQAASCLEGHDRIVVFYPEEHYLNQLCKDKSNCEILIVYDKSGLDIDLLSGTKVQKYNLVKNKPDLNLFKLDSAVTISSDVEGTLLNLTEIPNYQGISNESIKLKLYRKHFIDSFIKEVKK